jgi:hypothetical protein
MKKFRIENNCLNCNKKFHTILSRIKIGKGKYCSRECWKIINFPKVFKKCEICNKEFRIKPMRKKIARFCSIKCRYARKEDNPFFNKRHSFESRKKMSATKKNIPIDKWEKFSKNELGMLRLSQEYSDWRISVYKRDNYTCQICGKVGGKLNADHIKPFALYPKLRFDINNGRTLCINCHKNTDSYLNSFGKNQYVY